MNNKRSRFYYGWVIVAVSFITLFFSMGTRFTFGVYYIAMIGEYGWGRAETAGAFSLAMLFHAILAPVSGILIDRFGPRRLFPIGAAFLFLGLFAASRISAIWHLYLFFGGIMALGINMLSYSPVLSVIPKWFIKRRGLANGLVLSGIGVGILLLVPFNELMINALGWRSAFIVLSGIILFFLLPVTAIFFRRAPEDIGLCPDGVISKEAEPSPLGPEKDIPPSNVPEHWTFKAAARSKAFWLMTFSVVCDAFIVNMMLVHQPAYIVDLGYSTLLAASLVGLVGLIRSFGGILCGLFSDRVNSKAGYILGSILTFAGLFVLFFVRNTQSTWILYLFVILYGLGYGSRSAMSVTVSGDLFPGNALGRIMGVQSIGFGIGGALGAYLGGYFFDQTGTYLIPFLLLLASIVLGVIAVSLACRDRVRTSRDAVAQL
ncbi:MFS transporter [Thermodesulfobacteriota bacterium]